MNALGDVIGINAFIYWGSGQDQGSVGVGFGSPIKTANNVD